MDTTTSALVAYRQALYHCFIRARDALFDLGDALATHSSARTFVELSQAPCFQRRWPSLYEALEDGRIDQPALRHLFVQTRPRPVAGARLVLALDASSIPRPDARTAADRTLVHQATTGLVLPRGTAPVTPGWAFSTVVVVPDPVSSWTHILDNRRIPSQQTPVQSAAAQLADLLPLLPARPLCLLDGGYGKAPWVQARAALPCDQLGRVAATRVLYRPAPPRTGQRGAPRKDGPRFKGSAPATHGAPDATWTGTDAQGQTVTVRCWRQLHLKVCRDVPITVVCLARAAAAGTKRDPHDTWFWWLGGQALLPLADLARLYPRRFGIEHGYTFDIGDLLWTAPHLHTPTQMEHWTDMVRAVHNEIGLARDLVRAQRLPWEATTRPLTPRQVRRALGRIIVQVGTPAAAPRPRGKSPGRAHGAVIPPAPRHPVIRKGPARCPRRVA
ncbi:MAG: transposase [Chloroflexota bacterium]